MLNIKSTYTPKNRVTQARFKPSMIDIVEYWSKPGNKFNYNLYLKILEAKIKLG
jgi:hypothetical protein